ncbi:UDP-glucose/GDP-mannose dehydrogenase family protein [Thiomicrorhabdus sp. ZW0627]|uniref:UDP-glucose dehydrogenase family protein n=1 Tax=Thiomicrorhabdus sp. ZW0627 TaxID=3039774 RepID=UPI0024373FAA|nr:UDP-glucose/GDP-mannose dehydrogenase family protein [Thiomicrorhabdus sp. ZW0627]MDG6774067.1 UDP-glucose/GDP-mannose dehydrogenase family protein [Thiomicrorhabdus sp. ZW0627]
MKVSVFGCELSGLVTAGALAQTGNQVVAMPIGVAKVEDLRDGVLPREEPGLSQLVKSQIEEGGLVFESEWETGVEHGEVLILSMPSWRLDRAEEVVKVIGESATRDVLVVNQSSFPIGTADRFENQVKQAFARRGLSAEVSVVAMPEFISEGSAIGDFTRPDRIVLGSGDEEAIKKIRDLMRPFNRVTDQVKVMSTRAAEYTKFAVNALLATRISLINELANNAEHFEIDMEEVRQGLGSDSRIGFSYLYPGCGFGGPSFAADVKSLVGTLRSKGYDADLLKAVLSNNESQKEILFRKAWRFFNTDLKGKKIAVWGLSFKPNTSTVENAPSINTIEALVAQGASVCAYDPKAVPDFKANWQDGSGVDYSDDMYDALEGADALFILTEWKAFWNPDYALMKERMKTAVIFDGRNIYDPEVIRAQGFRYFGVGRGETV